MKSSQQHTAYFKWQELVLMVSKASICLWGIKKQKAKKQK